MHRSAVGATDLSNREIADRLVTSVHAVQGARTAPAHGSEPYPEGTPATIARARTGGRAGS